MSSSHCVTLRMRSGPDIFCSVNYFWRCNFGCWWVEAAGCGKIWPSRCLRSHVLTTLKSKMSTSCSSGRNLKPEPGERWKEDCKKLTGDENIRIITRAVWNVLTSPLSLRGKRHQDDLDTQSKSRDFSQSSLAEELRKGVRTFVEVPDPHLSRVYPNVMPSHTPPATWAKLNHICPLDMIPSLPLSLLF